jgi:hypothetical protein
MILQRMAKALRAQQWPTVVTEVMIVVVGIFLGLQADNWNNARLNQALATTYMSRIESELELQHKLLQRSSDYFTTARVHAVSALNGFSGSADTLDQQFAGYWFGKTVQKQ